MKFISTLRRLALVAVALAAAVTANAGALTIKSITCNDPALIKDCYFLISGEHHDVNLAGQPGDESWTVTNESSNFFNLYIEPQQGYAVNYRFTDPEGNLVKLMMGKAEGSFENKRANFSFNSNNGSDINIELNAEPVKPDASFKLTVIGDPSRVVASLNLKRVAADLQEGENTVEFSSASEGRLYLSCDPYRFDTFNNDGYFSSVTHNGADVKYTVNEIESMPTGDEEVPDDVRVTYGYQFPLKNGDEVVVNTLFDGPEYEITVEVARGFNEFVKEVMVNGVVVANPLEPFNVTKGDFVQVLGDAEGYKVNASRVNGQLTSKPLSEVGRFITEPTEFYFTVEKLTPSAIDELTAAPAPEASEQWFTLMGRPLPAAPKAPGLYIVNGAKRVVK